MKEKSTTALDFEKIIDKTLLARPASEQAKSYAAETEHAMLKQILKETGQLTLLVSLSLSLYNLAGKLKIAVLANKIISILTAITFSAGLYYGIVYMLNDKTDIANDQPAAITEMQSAKNISAIKNKIEFSAFTSTSVDKVLSDIIGNKIFAGIKAENINIAEHDAKNDKNIKYIIFNNIEDIDGSLQFYIKIIDKETSEVIHVLNKTIKKDNLEQECKNISQDIASHLQ